MNKKRKNIHGNKFPNTKDFLKLLAAGSILTMSVLVPTFPMIIAPIIGVWKDYDRRRLRDQVNRLTKRKLISIVEENGETVVKLTDKGRLRILHYKLEEFKIRKPERWDGKWRVIMFDVSEKKKKLRDAFREMVKRLGFYQLQKSVFIYPFSCHDEIEFLRQIYGVGDEVIYLLANHFEDEETIKEHFQLH